MTQIKRLLLLLLVAVAVPVQGAQAAADGICMTFGHHDAPGQLADHDHAAPGGADAESGDAETDHGDAHCGPCVSCCGASSIASPVWPAPTIVAPHAIHVPYVQQFAGLLSGGLDRPPLAL